MNFPFNADYTADNKPSLGFDPNDMSWKHQISGRIATQLTASPLGASSVYTQPSQDSTAYPQDNYVAGHVYTDQPGTLYLDVSSDNTNWDVQTSLSVTPNTPNFLPFTPIQGRYYRFRYVNGNAAQTVFRLEQIACNQIGTNRIFTNSNVLQYTLQNAATATDVGTAMNVDGYGVATLQITGSFTATIQFEGSVDGQNFVPITAHNRNDGTTSLTATAPGIYEIDCRGLQLIRANITSYTSGSITVTGRAEAFAGSSHSVQLTGSNAQSAAAVTPNDSANLSKAPTKGLYVGVTGDVKVDMSDGTTVTFTALSSGVIHPIACRKVYATGTTASSIVAVY